jgi:hypothetical protein
MDINSDKYAWITQWETFAEGPNVPYFIEEMKDLR